MSFPPTRRRRSPLRDPVTRLGTALGEKKGTRG
jgi:hypothetical protein